MFVITPPDRNLKLDADSGTEEWKPTHYPQLVRSLIYITITQPNLNYPIGLHSQLMQTPRDIYLDCVKGVLIYVSGTIDQDILYESATLTRLEGYTNVDWAGYKAYRQLTSEFVNGGKKISCASIIKVIPFS